MVRHPRLILLTDFLTANKRMEINRSKCEKCLTNEVIWKKKWQPEKWECTSIYKKETV